MKRMAGVVLAMVPIIPSVGQVPIPVVAPDASTATLQPVAPLAAAQVPDPAACELHVWRSQTYVAQSSGLISGFGLLPALADMAAHEGDNRTTQGQLRNQLDQNAQKEVLAKADWPALMRRPSVNILWEEGGLDVAKAKALKKSVDRAAPSVAHCYAELHVGTFFYQRATLYGSNLYTGFVYRDFTSGAPTYVLSSVKSPLERFPAKNPAELAASTAEVRNAFALNLAKFFAKKVNLQSK